MKVILCNTPHGQYQIPLESVARHRADYYACEVDGHEKNSPEWREEVIGVMNDKFEGIDWMLNNSDWQEWKPIAVKVNDKINVTDADFWTCSDDFEIIDVT